MKWLKRLGIEKPLFQWSEPRVATQWEWRHKGWPECKEFFPIFGKIGALVGIPILIPTKIWLPEGFLTGLLAITFFCVALPAAVAAQMWVNSKTEAICGIYEKGVSKSFSVLCEWENIIAYSFDNHAELAGVRYLSVTARDEDKQYQRQYCFDPNEVDEAKIRELIKLYLTK